MSLQVKTKYLVFALIIALCMIFFFGWRLGRGKGDNASTGQIDSLNKRIEYLALKLQDKTLYVAKVEQEIITQKEAIRRGELDKAELKALNIKSVSEITRLKGQIRILADSIANTGNVIIIRDCDTTTTDTTKAIKLPFTFGKIDKFYQLSGGFDLNGQMNVRLTVPMELDIISGWNKKTKTYNAVAVSPNPYISFNGINSFKMGTVKPKPYGIGIQGGYGVMMGKPVSTGFYFGVGLSYNIIRF